MTGTTQKTVPSVGFVSLGCPKALVDTERIVTELRAEGYLIARDYRHSDIVIVNTCAFIDAPKVLKRSRKQCVKTDASL